MCRDLKSGLSEKTKEIVTIFQDLIKLNPYLRPTAYECLKKKVFDPFRNLAKEKVLDSMLRKR